MPHDDNTSPTTNSVEPNADIPTLVRSTAHDGIEAARQAAATAAQQVAAVAGAAAGQARAGVESLRHSIEQAEVPALVRRPVPLGAVLGWAAAALVVIYLMSRRRH
jgi:hypothetical protein